MYNKQNKKSLYAREFFLGVLVILGFMAILIALSGCSSETLDPTGVYGSGQALGTNAFATNVDGSVVTNQAVTSASLFLENFDSDLMDAETTLDNLLLIELNNRTLLSQWPAIKQTADTIRLNVPRWTKAIELQRDAYASMPNAANQSALSIGLTQFQSAASQLQPLLAAHVSITPTKSN